MSTRSRTRGGTNGSGISSGAFCAFAFALVACGSTVSSVEPTRPDQDGIAHKQYRIECIRADECKRIAARTCGPNYSVVSEWNNTIPESSLPGLNEQSDQSRPRDWEHYHLRRQTGIESPDPMPLTSIVVACRN